MFYLPKISQNKQRDLFFLLILIITSSAFTSWYISQEDFIYTYDYSAYQGQAQVLIDDYRVSWKDGIIAILNSLSDDYNYLFTIPLFPSLIMFGNSRIGFILSNVLTYVVPFCLLTGAISSCFSQNHKRLFFWITTFVTAAIPMTWLPSLRGWPDIGGFTFIAFAILILLRPIGVDRKIRLVFIGFCLASAFLFRRHFAYSARAFIIALFLELLLFSLLNRTSNLKQKIKSFLDQISSILIIIFSAAILVCIVSWKTIEKLITIDYRKLYQAYEVSSSECFDIFVKYYGILFLVVAILGYFLILIRYQKTPSFRKVFFVFSFFCISSVQWFLVGRQNSIHYTTSLSSFIGIGVSGFLYSGLKSFQSTLYRFIMVSVFICLLIYNFYCAVTEVGSFYNQFRPLFALNQMPLKRNDIPEVKQIIDFMRQHAKSEQKIYIAAASSTLNEDILRVGEPQLYNGERSFNVLPSMSVDSRDFYPLERLLEADFVMIANPIQTPLIPEQKVIRVVLDLFNHHKGIAQDFQKFGRNFTLENGVVIEIYSRIRETSLKVALESLKVIRDTIIPIPASQPYWISLEPCSLFIDHPYSTSKINQIDIQNSTENYKNNKISLIYFGTLTNKMKLTSSLIQLNDQCHGILVHINEIDQNLDSFFVEDYQYKPHDKLDLSLNINSELSQFLELDFSPLVSSDFENFKKYCSVSISNLELSPF